MAKMKIFCWLKGPEMAPGERRDRILKQFRDHGIGYAVTHPRPDEIENFLEFVDYAFENYGVRTIASLSHSRAVWIDPRYQMERAALLRQFIRDVKGHEGFYSIYLDDEPVSSYAVEMEAWRPFLGQFTSETGIEVPPDYAQWDMRQRRAFMLWRAEKFTEHTAALRDLVRSEAPEVKVLMDFNHHAVFPTFSNPVQTEELMDVLDIVMTDIYPGWHWIPYDKQYVVAFYHTLIRSLIGRKELWCIVQGHRILDGYEPDRSEMRRWCEQAWEAGCTGIGWYDAYPSEQIQIRRAEGLGAPITDADDLNRRNRWQVMLELSAEFADRDVLRPERTPIGALVSWDSVLSQVSDRDGSFPLRHRPLFNPFVTLAVFGGLKLRYVSDRSLLDGRTSLDGLKVLFISPSCVVQRAFVEVLKDFVRRGGIVIGTDEDLCFDEGGRHLSGAREEIFGVKRFSPTAEPLTIDVQLKHGSFRGLPALVRRLRLTELVDGTEVLGRWSDGSPAVVSRLLGRGRAIYVGTDPYTASVAYGEDRRWGQCFRTICESLGME